MTDNLKIDSIDTLEGELAQRCLSTLKSEGASNSTILQIETLLREPKVSCYAVSEETKLLAVFDIRNAPDFIKNLEIFYSPAISLNFDGETDEIIRDIFDTRLNVLINIFFFLFKAAQKKGQLKIRSDSVSDGIFFANVSQQIKKEFTDIEKIKIYNKWVEIIWKTREK